MAPPRANVVRVWRQNRRQAEKHTDAHTCIKLYELKHIMYERKCLTYHEAKVFLAFRSSLALSACSQHASLAPAAAGAPQLEKIRKAHVIVGKTLSFLVIPHMPESGHCSYFSEYDSVLLENGQNGNCHDNGKLDNS